MITANSDIKVIDFVIIGCDGIWGCLRNQEACDIIIKRLRDKPQNMTCVVIVFKKDKK